MHVSVNGVGLPIRYSELKKKDQDILGKLIAAGRDRIEED